MRERIQRLAAALFVASLGLAATCSSGLVIDRSMQAVAAGDYTLAVSACGAVPGGGMDICRVKEGAPIESSWRLIVPAKTKKQIKGGELTVYYRDISKTYTIADKPLIEIPWRDFFGAATWQRSMDGEALALAQIRYVTPEGIEELFWARGIAKIVVTRQGYDPLPLDSGFAAWSTTCKISYSTAGRSVVKCK